MQIRALVKPVAALVLGLVVALLLAPGSFIKVCSRSIESECRAYLKHAYTAQRALLSETGRYSMRIHELGFQIEAGNRYAYFLGPGPLEPRGVRVEAAEGFEPDLRKGYRPFDRRLLPRFFTGGVPVGIDDSEVTMVCAREDDSGNVDLWSISSRPRLDRAGRHIGAGVPWREVERPEPFPVR